MIKPETLISNFMAVLLTAFLWSWAPQAMMAQDFIPPMPSDLAKTRISLMTVGLGDNLYSRYGHTMLRVEDPSNNLDYMVNWGIFDFSDPMFIPKFFRGILIYQMGFSGSGATINYYRNVEKRRVIEDELALSENQKKQLMEKIIWNAQPANYKYPYQYFRNNCATIPRDYLDELAGGTLKRQFGNINTEYTYRDYVRTNLAINPFVAWGLDVIFNSDSDHKITAWQEMFYPVKLREYLAKAPRVGDDGQIDESQPLLINHRVVVDLPSPPDEAIDGYLMTWIVSGLPLFFVGFLMLTRMRENRVDLPKWCFRVFGVVSLWWGLTHGFFGLTHFAAWLFSSHTDLHHNLNILLFWPFDMLVVILGVQMGVLGRAWNFKGLIPKVWWRYLALGHLVLIPVYAIVSYLGFSGQDTSRVLAFMAPLSVLYFIVLARLVSCYPEAPPKDYQS